MRRNTFAPPLCLAFAALFPVNSDAVLVCGSGFGSGTTPLVAPVSSPQVGPRTVLAIPLHYSDNDLLFGVEEIEELMRHGDQLMQVNSRGRSGIVATVMPTLQLPHPLAHYDGVVNHAGKLYEDAIALVREYERAAGETGRYDPSRYQTVAVFFPTNTKFPFSGLGALGGQALWMNGHLNRSVFIHELGHNLGFPHPRLISPGADLDPLNGVVLPERGNAYDIMGSGNFSHLHFSAPHKADKGWLAGETIEVTQSGTFRLYANDNALNRSGTRLLQVTPPGGGDVYFTFELRGRDAVAIARRTRGQPEADFIDVVPLSGSPDNDGRDLHLPPGKLLRSDRYQIAAVVTMYSEDPDDPWVDLKLTLGNLPRPPAPTLRRLTATVEPVPRVTRVVAEVENPGGGDFWVHWKLDKSFASFAPGPTLEFTPAVGGPIKLTATVTNGLTESEPVAIEFTVPDPLLELTPVGNGGRLSVARDRVFAGWTTSPNGLTWAPIKRTGGGALSLESVADGSGCGFVGVANASGQPELLTSQDGLTWSTIARIDGLGAPRSLHRIGDRTLVIDHNDRASIVDDQGSATEFTLPGTSAIVSACTWQSRYFVVARSRLYWTKDNFDPYSQVFVSEDGRTWTRILAMQAWMRYLLPLGRKLVVTSDTEAPLLDGTGFARAFYLRSMDRYGSPGEMMAFPGRQLAFEGSSVWAVGIDEYWRNTELSGGAVDSQAVYAHGRAYLNRGGQIVRSEPLIIPPEIRERPAQLRLGVGQPASLQVTPEGPTETLHVQWQKDGQDIAGANSTTLQLGVVQLEAAGRYTVTLANQLGTRTFTVADVQTLGASPARLANLSVRGRAGMDDRTLIAGFVLGGQSPSGLLIRGIGPSLRDFGVTGAITGTTLTVFDRQGVRLHSAAAWGGSAAVQEVMQRLGAFPLSVHSQDAAIYESLPAGLYSVAGSPTDGREGEALLELYADPLASDTARLVNLSSRGPITATAPMIAGFNIGGESSMTIIIRGIGPTLRAFGVGNAAEDTILRVYNSRQELMAENDRWSNGDANAMAAAFTSVGAFPLEPESEDAAIVLHLPPGGYSAHLLSKQGGSTVGLIELFQRD